MNAHESDGRERRPPIETHTDGSLWVACTKDEPKKERSQIIDGKRVTTYHPDARVTFSSHDGADDHYECPHCGLAWWVEYD